MMDKNNAEEATTYEEFGGDPDTSTTILVGIVGCILVFVVIVAVQALFYNTEREIVSMINQGDPRQLSQVRAEQLEAINSYGWKDRDKGVVTIPIDRAMELVVEELVQRTGGPGDQGTGGPGEEFSPQSSAGRSGD